ncbi:ATP-dependent DNA ligase [Leucobacter triazinivorans]|uniref:ATP-dependent DNA ligase n=1 Tax=Leucobacter triazinivorans TaxID=1784719 RepID=A0A4P6KDA9_9MICO|nr:ATP-dependent DNA ligase [Leucobacter triazinivorans]QBE47858.1 ATP-dependent DNA ligase [Leucobacter triazinivorans]
MEHLRYVITAKLRRRESFFLTWHPRDTSTNAPRAAGPVTLWVSPSSPIGFEFSSSAPGPLSREWISALMSGSYGTRGLLVIPERAVQSRRAAGE